MQGIREFIPTDIKIRYINQLLKVGFDTIDFGSFVSPKAIPQMRDTAEVLSQLELGQSRTRLLAIVANRRGAEEAASLPAIDFLGYPFSISETFQMRNTNATIAESLELVGEIQQLCRQRDKELVVYVSMGFGNPYGDPWNVDIVSRWVDELADLGIRIIQLSDTIGVSNAASIDYLFSSLLPKYEPSGMEIGAHLHTEPHNWREKVEAAFNSGCRRFDGAMKGYGGCPMAKDELTGNMPTELMCSFFREKGAATGVDERELRNCLAMASEIFLN
jgi:hydroxymethylglutaryl-CoA lyase